MADTKVYFSTINMEDILKVEGLSCEEWQVKKPAGLRRTAVSTHGEKLERMKKLKVRGGKVRKNEGKKRDVGNYNK